MTMRLRRLLAIVLSAPLLLGLARPTRTYDFVISNGRVMYPESGLDWIAHVAPERLGRATPAEGRRAN